MKKSLGLLILSILIVMFGGFVIKDIGYEKVPIEDGSLFGRIEYAGKDSIVIIIGGSGQTDMNGNSVLTNGRNDSLAQLAKELRLQGISSFRYDKRTAGKSAITFAEQNPDFNLFVSDCVACIRYVKDKGYEKIYLAGHSQGSLVGILAAQQESVDGFISIAGAGFPIDVTLEKQLTSQLGGNSREVNIIRKLRTGKIDETVDPADPNFNPDVQRFIQSWMKHNPSEVIAQLNCPILLIQGSVDLHVDVSDFNALKNAVDSADVLYIDDMNHVLKNVYSQEEQTASYLDPSYNVNENLVSAIVAFISN